MEDGTLYALFQTDGEMKLNRYEYDPDAVSEVTEVLKLYTVYEDSLLKQAATLYHKAHPEVLINIESAYPQYYFDTPDYDAVYQKLNTMLMGDQAPDLVVMDHLNMDSYADKGLLADVEDILKPLEDGGELLSNITGAYVREDGKRYGASSVWLPDCHGKGYRRGGYALHGGTGRIFGPEAGELSGKPHSGGTGG